MKQKTLFIVFEGLPFGEKNKNLTKNSRHKLYWNRNDKSYEFDKNTVLTLVGPIINKQEKWHTSFYFTFLSGALNRYSNLFENKNKINFLFKLII